MKYVLEPHRGDDSSPKPSPAASLNPESPKLKRPTLLLLDMIMIVQPVASA